MKNLSNPEYLIKGVIYCDSTRIII